jgi:large subunit ribosomal protein L15
MAIKPHDLQPAPGSTKRRMRVGRGIAAGKGKTAGRGTKGQHARRQVKPGFEGGQMPLHRRMPKLRGFNNPFKITYNVINLDDLAKLAADGVSMVDPDVLRTKGLVHKHGMVKVLGHGELGAATLSVKAHGFSGTASAAITGAGGSVEILPPPFGNGRPPAKGNALTNR